MNLRLGEMFCNAEDFSKSIAPCLTAIKLSENDPSLLAVIISANHQLGRAYFALRDWPALEKVSVYQASLESVLNDPRQSFLFAYSYYWLGYCDLRKHDYKSAIQHFSVAIPVFKLTKSSYAKYSYDNAQAGLDEAKRALGINETSIK
jgi:tetratricopeptide (TPR) repeat protein